MILACSEMLLRYHFQDMFNRNVLWCLCFCPIEILFGLYCKQEVTLLKGFLKTSANPVAPKCHGVS